VTSRDKEQVAPRDNVVFELGLFMGCLDRSRVFLIKENGRDVKIPTDLLGITPITFTRRSDNLAASMGPVCTELRKVILELGVR
jgi:CRP/FNR family transcriptional regulator, cyclic AMP receptor protein